MNTDLILLILRGFSALLLLTMMGTLCYIIWKDYRGTVDQLQAGRRVYGELIQLLPMDGSYIVTGESYPLLPLTSLGRSPTNEIVINDSFASSEHAVVFLRDGQWWLEDRRSRNGTTLNEVPIDRPVVMTSGDIIGIGHKHFRLELER